MSTPKRRPRIRHLPRRRRARPDALGRAEAAGRRRPSASTAKRKPRPRPKASPCCSTASRCARRRGAPWSLPTLALAQAIAAEWDGPGRTARPKRHAFDAAGEFGHRRRGAGMAEVEADAVKYAGSDLICYRADGPDSLVRAQTEAWDPLVQFAREKCGARLILCEGVTFHPQSPEALAAVAARARAHVGAGAGSPFRLAALHAMTTLTGSCIVALAVALREIDAEAGFAAAYVDEDHQMRVWGADAEAMARRERRRGRDARRREVVGARQLRRRRRIFERKSRLCCSCVICDDKAAVVTCFDRNALLRNARPAGRGGACSRLSRVPGSGPAQKPSDAPQIYWTREMPILLEQYLPLVIFVGALGDHRRRAAGRALPARLQGARIRKSSRLMSAASIRSTTRA